MISKIEIEFPFPVKFTDEILPGIAKLIDDLVCRPYEQEHPDRVMWPAGMGFKPLISRADAMFLGKSEWSEHIKDGDEPDFDEGVLQIEVSERERYVDERTGGEK